MPRDAQRLVARNAAVVRRTPEARAAAVAGDATGAAALQARLQCGDAGGVIEAAIQRLCACLTAALSGRGQQIGVRLPGHVAPPPGARGLMATAGIEDGAGVSLGASATAFTTVATLTPARRAAGAFWGFGHALEDALAWASVEWRVRIGEDVIYGPWFGQVGTIEAPLIFPAGFPFFRGAPITLEGRNTLAAAVNAMAVLHAWQWAVVADDDQPVHMLQVDIG